MVQITPFPALAALPDSTPKSRITESITLVGRAAFEISLSELLAEPVVPQGLDLDPIVKAQVRGLVGSQRLKLEGMQLAGPLDGGEIATATEAPVAVPPRALEQQAVPARNLNERQWTKESQLQPGRLSDDEPASSAGPRVAEENSGQTELSVLEYPTPIATDLFPIRDHVVGHELSRGDRTALASKRSTAIATLEMTEMGQLQASEPQHLGTRSLPDDIGNGETRAVRGEASAPTGFQLGRERSADGAIPWDSGSPIPKKLRAAPAPTSKVEQPILATGHEPRIEPSQHAKTENAPVGQSAAVLSSKSSPDRGSARTEDRATTPAIEDNSNPGMADPVEKTRSKPVISSPVSTRAMRPELPVDKTAIPVGGAGHPARPLVDRPIQPDVPSSPNLDVPIGESQIALSFEDGSGSAMNSGTAVEPQRLHHVQLETLGLRSPFTEHIPRVIGLIAKAAQGLGERPVELLLNPEELGKVRMTLQSTDNGMVVQLTVERPETLDLLRRNIDLLANDLRQAGYDRLSFGFSGNDSFQRDSTPSQSGHQAGGQKPPETITDAPQPILLTDSAAGLDLRI